MIVILSLSFALTIFFMFAYAKELRRRDNFDDYMSVWLNEVWNSLEHYESQNKHSPEWLETKRDILECLIKEFRK